MVCSIPMTYVMGYILAPLKGLWDASTFLAIVHHFVFEKLR
jgi:hypothetical protein